jgi:pimeloyl-ACP methyl ester carboxylesterase
VRSQWTALLASLPRAVDLPHPVSGRIESVMLDRAALQAMARAPLYAPALAAALPAAIAEGAAGRLAPLAALAGALGGGAGGLASGMHFSVVCAEDLNPAAPTVDDGPGAARVATSAPDGASDGGLAALYRQACADWPRGSVPAAFYALPLAAVPTWLLSGGLDPVTPPRHGARVARALGARARHIVVPNAGHGVSALGCVRDAITRFITTDDDAAALAVDADCAARVPRPPAFAPPGADAAPAAEAAR